MAEGGSWYFQLRRLLGLGSVLLELPLFKRTYLKEHIDKRTDGGVGDHDEQTNHQQH